VGIRNVLYMSSQCAFQESNFPCSCLLAEFIREIRETKNEHLCIPGFECSEMNESCMLLVPSSLCRDRNFFVPIYD